ncbi:hypothetical protein KQY30_02480 [Streptomyces sp. GMY02]|uniref:hypothetical protein n=1 Tax=Streptomyces sp. GMY02 TaxID=1333528 RepID=UPI001C2C892A|nr:hypothetical protein [Streptomyces sp. GMY02]QXE33329.1 hypothetical protein KQY30_02480 [Streptomyces sp. GMY02]
MEQHTDPIILPTHPAGTDPAFIPGLVPPRPAGADEEDGAAPEQVADTPPDAPEAAAADSGAEAAAAPDAPNVPGEGAADDRAEEPVEESDDGPVFEISDRRGTIVADHAGITFRLDGEEAQFAWEEVKAVETDVPRFGRRFGITVYTSPQRWFQHDIEGSSREQLKQWTKELDAVLDARFDDGEA